MVHRSPSARPGITLIEVLAAIFIMGVGLLALFTLFPLGALSMARAVRDDRAAAIAANAASIATALDLRNDQNVLNAFNAAAPAGFNGPDANGPGYPVLVDPTYAALGVSSLGSLTGVTPGVQRCGASYATGGTNIARWFTFQEEITFTTNGQASSDPAKLRPGTYTWTYLLRRPRSSRPDLIEMSVIVYATRAIEVADGEAVFNGVTGTAGSTSLSFNYTAGSKPNIRRGTWIMDTSYVTSGSYGTVNGYAYRVENVTDTGATNITLDVDPPLKANMTTLVVLENVIAVIDRSTTWKP